MKNVVLIYVLNANSRMFHSYLKQKSIKMCTNCPYINNMTCPKGKSINGYKPRDLGVFCTDVKKKVARFVLCMFSLTNSLRTGDRFEKNKWCKFPENSREFVNCSSYVNSVLESLSSIKYGECWYLSNQVFGSDSKNLQLIRNINDFSLLETGAVLFCINYEHICCQLLNRKVVANVDEAVLFMETMIHRTNSEVISELRGNGVSPTHVMFYIDYLYQFGLSDRYIGGMNHPNGTDGVYKVQSLNFNDGFVRFPGLIHNISSSGTTRNVILQDRKFDYVLIGWNW